MGSFFSSIESLSRTELRALQLERLKKQVAYLSRRSPYYQRLFKEVGIGPKDIRSLDDLEKIPFSDKFKIADGQERIPPFGDLLCVSETEIVKYFRTSGTTFRPRNFCYTFKDWMHYTVEAMARMKFAIGIKPDDRALIAFPYSTFISLWTAHYACERIGCMVIPGGGTSSKERLALMKNMKVTVLCATPTYAYHLSNVAKEEGIDLGEIPLKCIHTGGEPLSAVPGSRARLEEIWGTKVYDEYGFSEGGVPVGGECMAQDGIHVNEDMVIAEVLDNEGHEVPPGRQGELVVTNIVSETMPVLRFKTGDIVTYTDEPCICGRNTIRIKVLGRTDDMIVIKGTNLFPATVEEIIRRCPELSGDFLIIIDKVNETYELIIQAEPDSSRPFSDHERAATERKMIEMFRENLRLRPVVEIKEPGTLPRFEVKSKRLIDRRPKATQGKP